MVTEVNYKEEYTVNAFDATIDSFEISTSNNHFISYKGKLYQRDDFLYTFFADYKKYKKRVKFLNDNILYLSSNQRNKLQYHILAQEYELLTLDKETDENDKRDLLLFCKKYKSEHEQAQQWYNRMAWEQGHEKIITFAVSLEVQGTLKGVWCYTSNIDSKKATFNGVLMDWETWVKSIIDRLNIVREQIKRKNITDKKQRAMYYSATYEAVKPMLYYQSGKHLTLPAVEIDAIRAWVYKYLDNGKEPFPYIGNIPLSNLAFTIDFEKDIEIVDTHDIRDMAEYNREQNAQHNQDMGKRMVENTFSRLVGDEWKTHEIIEQGFSKPQIARFYRDGLIDKVGHGDYIRVKVFK